MLEILNETMDCLEDNDKTEGQAILEKIENIEQEDEKYYDCSPCKPQDHGGSPPGTDRDSDNTPRGGAEEEVSPTSGQGHP